MFWTGDRVKEQHIVTLKCFLKKEDIVLPDKEEPKMNARRHQGNVNLDSEVNRLAATPPSVVQRLLLACGVVGPVLFIVTFLIEGVTRPGYNSLVFPVSALESGPLGWIQVANFIVFGFFIGGFAVGLRKALVGGIGVIWLPLLEGVVALGLLGDGIFTHDPLHTVCDVVTFTSALVVCIIFARRFAGDSRWRGWATYSIVTGILLVVFLTTFGVAMTHHGPAGLFEKLAILVRAIWTILLAARLLVRPGRLSPQEEIQLTF